MNMKEVIDTLISHPMETILVFGLFYLVVRCRDRRFRYELNEQIYDTIEAFTSVLYTERSYRVKYLIHVSLISILYGGMLGWNLQTNPSVSEFSNMISTILSYIVFGQYIMLLGLLTYFMMRIKPQKVFQNPPHSTIEIPQQKTTQPWKQVFTIEEKK